jgi:hypothetical protein
MIVQEEIATLISMQYIIPNIPQLAAETGNQKPHLGHGHLLTVDITTPPHFSIRSAIFMTLPYVS